MPEWLLQSGFNTQVTAAIWSTIVAIASALVLFIYTMSLRFRMVIDARRRIPLIARWRRIFAVAVVSDATESWQALPPIESHQWPAVLEEWNTSRRLVAGTASDNLITLGRHIGIQKVARDLLHKRQVASKLLGIQTLGHLRDEQSWSDIQNAVASDNSTVSVIAAAALVDIDPKRALRILVPLISIRRDWLQTRVAMFLREAGSALISEPLFRAIRTSDPKAQVFLMKFAPLTETSIADAIASDLLRDSNDPGVLAAALEVLTGYDGLPRIEELSVHESWLVRLRVAQILGRAGSKEHLPILESMLEDPEWWVRYRAAQAIVTQPYLGRNGLLRLQRRQIDRYASDMLGQAIAEAGL
jgi:HEAT repeat protein